MANILMPKGHVMLKGSSASRVAEEPLIDTGRRDTALLRRVPVNHGPIGDIAASRGGVVSVNAGDDSVTILDPTTMTRVATVPVDGEPVTVASSEDLAFVAVASDNYDAVSVIDLGAGEVIANYPLAFGVTSLAVSPDGKRVYAGRTQQDRVDVAVIDVTAERVGSIEIGRAPAANIDALSVDPAGTWLYVAVTDVSGSRLVVVDTETSLVQRVIPVGAPIRDIDYAGGAVYVLTSDRAIGGAVHVIDLATMKVTDSVPLGGAPTRLVMGYDQSRAYIVDYDRVAVLCTLSLELLDSLTVDARPSCVTRGANGSRLYIADYAGSVSMFSVESSIEMLYTQFLATDPMALNMPRARQQPVTA